MQRGLSLAGIATLVALSVSAEEPLEEIVVTADFEPKPIRDVPASLVVLSEETVRDGAVQHFEELVQLVPNLNLSGEGNRARFFQLRGIGELAQYQGAPNPSVGFIVDDVDFSGVGGVATLFDVEQIEVLRGPQGTRYGANGLAGLIYVTTAQPPEDFQGRLELTLGDEGTRGLGLSVGGPITETWAGRLSWHGFENNGFRDNPFLGRDDTNGRDESALRAKLLWKPTDRLDATFSAFYADVNDGYDAFAIDNGLTTFSDRPGQDAQRSLGGSLRIVYEGERYRLTSITGAARSDITFSFDADWGNPEFWDPFVYDFISVRSRDRETLNQELRLSNVTDGPVDWLIGLYGLNLREALRATDAGVLVQPGFSLFLDDSAQSAYDANSRAIFGELTREFSGGWRLSVGARWESRSADYQDSRANRFSPDEDMVGGHVSLLKPISDDINVFARIARGYKAGGFNLIPGQSAELLSFDAEFLWSYEVGLRGSILEGRLSGDLVAFWSERDDQQVETTTQLDPNNPASFVFATSNAGSGSNRGIEASFDFTMTDRWRLTGAIGLLDTEVEEFGQNTALPGRDQAHAPRFSFQFGALYEGQNGWFGRLDWVGQGDQFIDYFEAGTFFDVPPNFCIDQKLAGYRLVNLRAGLRRDRWSAELWARNLFDENYGLRGFCFGNEPPNFQTTLYSKRGDPRHYGLTLRVNF